MRRSECNDNHCYTIQRSKSNNGNLYTTVQLEQNTTVQLEQNTAVQLEQKLTAFSRKSLDS